MNIDLDAARRARAETLGEQHSVTLGEREFALPSELPFTFAEELARQNFRVALESLFGEESAAFFALTPTNEDLRELVEGIAELYVGGTSGESQASAASSSTGTKRSKPRSSKPTG